MDLQQLLESALQDAQAGRFADAETKFLKVLEQPLGERDAGTIQGLLGAVYAAKGDHAQAAETLAEASAKNPDDASIACNLSNSLNELGRPEDAIAAARKSIVLEPGYAEAHNNLGNALKASGDLAAAAESYRQAIAASPGYAIAHNNLGIACFDLGDLDTAAASYR